MGSIVSVQKIAAKKIGISYGEYIAKIVSQKWCTCCKSWVDRNNFGVDRSRGDGLKSKCNGCVRVENPWQSLKGRVSMFKDRKHTEKSKKLMSESLKGKPSPMKNKKHSIETRLAISKILRERGVKGERCHSYKDGKVAERRGLRHSAEYKRWRFDVFIRDNFTCQECGDNKGGNLNAHHKKPFADFPELRLDVSNGVTLCEECHKKEHK